MIRPHSGNPAALPDSPSSVFGLFPKLVKDIRDQTLLNTRVLVRRSCLRGIPHLASATGEREFSHFVVLKPDGKGFCPCLAAACECSGKGDEAFALHSGFSIRPRQGEDALGIDDPILRLAEHVHKVLLRRLSLSYLRELALVKVVAGRDTAGKKEGGKE